MDENNSKHLNKITLKHDFDKAVHTLEGLIKGIAIDGFINEKEKSELSNWLSQNVKLLNYETFNEITPILNGLFLNKNLNENERKDLLWLCNNYKAQNNYFNVITSDIHILEGILHGIMADNIITDTEIMNLEKWMSNNKQLKGLYPYDELNSLLFSILKDKIITKEEKNFLKVFISQFIDYKNSKNIDSDEIEELKKSITINGICAINPEIIIKNNLFCFTGISSKADAISLINTIKSKDGLYKDQITNDTNYLIIGDEGNPCWAFSCYGRKVEDALMLRKKGGKILIVRENDFHSSLGKL